MDVLRDAELQLLRLVATLQQKLLVGKDPLAGGSRGSAAAVHKVLNSIEGLQDKLRDCAHQIAACATQPNYKNAPQREDIAAETADSDTETEDEDLLCHHETKICDQLKPKTSSREANEPGLRASGQQDELRLIIANYADSTAWVAAMDEHANDERFKLHSFEQSSGAAMAALVRFVEEGGAPSEETAASFRDATLLLPGIVSRLHEQRHWGISWLTKTVANIKSVFDLAKDNQELPRPLADPQLEAIGSELSELKEVFYPGRFQRMEDIIRAVKSNPSALKPDDIADTLNLLLIHYQRTFREYSQQHRLGKHPPWTEQQWWRFATISEVLGRWIHRAGRASPKPKLRGIFCKFDRQLGGFANNNPGRVPPSLLEALPVLKQLAQLKGQHSQTSRRSNKRYARAWR